MSLSILRNLITSLALLAGSISFAQELKIEDQDLTDYMSPAELMREIGVSSGVAWQGRNKNPRLVIVIDRAERGTSQTAQTLEVYVDGMQTHSFKTSTGKEKRVSTPDGKSYFATTPPGEFQIDYRSIDHKSKKWDGADMPFAQFFNGGIAIHATVPSHFEALGRRDSGGCARLHPTNAKIVWSLVGEIGVKETKVIVFDGSYQKHPVEKSWDDPYTDQFPVATPKPTPKQKPTPIPAPKPTSTPVQQWRPQPMPQYPQYPPQYQPQYPPQYQPQYPTAQPQYPQGADYPPARWIPSANPTPPPKPPPGIRDSYPYCRNGFWCPYN